MRLLYGEVAHHDVETPLGVITESYVTNVGEPYPYSLTNTISPQNIMALEIKEENGGLTLSDGRVFISEQFDWNPKFGFGNRHENHRIYRKTGKSRSRFLRFQDPELEEINEAILQTCLTGAFWAELEWQVDEAEHRANRAEMLFIHDILKQQEENEKLIKEFRAKHGWHYEATEALRSKWS